MKTTIYIVSLIVLFALTSCDPHFGLRLENQTKQKIEVIYYPVLDSASLRGHKPENIEIRGQKMYQVTLDANQTIMIGDVVARYTPISQNINLDYLEVRFGSDTITLTGRNAIFATLQKVDKFDWRIIIK